MRVLVVGGAGYIGSHMVKMLLEEGHAVVTLDNLSGGFRDAVSGGEFVLGDLADSELLANLFSRHRFDGVMHFASYIQVGESVREPAKYYRNNVANTLNLLDAMVAHDVRCLIFSSSAAIFGQPQYVPIDELHPQQPINPYGRSKLMVEQMLEDYDLAYGLRSVCLRYFNAAGGQPGSGLGERHEPETHLIPLVLQAASGRRESVTIFGSDYDTPDGTCVRDYVHVTDICRAHLLALGHLQQDGSSRRYNLGNGKGFSVREVVEAAGKITGRDICVLKGARREGDPAYLIADASLIHDELGWAPAFSELEAMVSHAWQWECMRSHLKNAS
ncbi:MAG: UDP-glucose 4-epimerase GalE [Thiohalomonadaceae bacterium]